jgi:hypothetical protein
MIQSFSHVEGALGKTVLNANSRLVEVINAYEALELTAKARLSEEDSMQIKREKLVQDCAKGITTVNVLSEALALLQPEDTYLPHEALAMAKEMELTCRVSSFLWLLFGTYLIPIEPVS